MISVCAWLDHRLRQAAVLTDPGSGRSVEVATSAPGLQFYSGNFLDGTTIGKGGVAYPKYGGVALESQVHHDIVYNITECMPCRTFGSGAASFVLAFSSIPVLFMRLQCDNFNVMRRHSQTA